MKRLMYLRFALARRLIAPRGSFMAGIMVSDHGFHIFASGRDHPEALMIVHMAVTHLRQFALERLAHHVEPHELPALLAAMDEMSATHVSRENYER